VETVTSATDNRACVDEDPKWVKIAPIVLSLFALCAASASAFYASRQSHTASDTAKRQLRPYITLVSGPDAPKYTRLNKQRGQKIVADTTFENYGQTPAYDVRISLEVKVLEYPLPEGFDFRTQHVDKQGLVGPHGDAFNRSMSETALNDPDDVGVNKGDSAVYVYGRVDYEDSWRVPHWTDFCIWYNSLANYIAVNCARHNEGDRER
jgi:hypothetical protein